MELAAVHTVVREQKSATVSVKHYRYLWCAGLAVSVLGTSCAASESTTAAASTSTSTSITTSSTTTTIAPTAMADFVTAADAICAATWPKVLALTDPDGVGGQKQLGLGTVVREWAEALAGLVAPPDIAADWAEATELLRRSGVKLEEAEQLAASGDSGASGAAQSEALWSLQPSAAEMIIALHIPFRVCTFG